MSNRQVAMVMDLNKCIGCQTCTVACKTLWTRREGMRPMLWNTVNTLPGQGTPHGWERMGGGFDGEEPRPGHRPAVAEFGKACEFNYDAVFYGGQGHVPLRPTDPHPGTGPNHDEDIGAGEFPNSYFFYLPRICNHCTHPACLEACPRQAIDKRAADGVVLIDEDRCRGYRFCQEACPYKKIYYNEVRGISQKCIFCFPRIDQGVANACVRQCPGRVRFVGYLDDPLGPIHKLVYQYRVALPLHPEYGTQPNVYYVPPLSPEQLDAAGNPTGEPRIPLAYLESLFGRSVGDALAVLKEARERNRSGQPSELMDLLIARDWTTMLGPFHRHPRSVEQVVTRP
jgi:ethylbenzene hydroxylase subunit beta/complex iron-sulfur molybdoenzyme family reductase subunit beta